MPHTNVMPKHFDLYYGGGWNRPQSGHYVEVTSPGSGEILGRVAEAGAADVAAAVAAARRGFGEWRRVLPLERARIRRGRSQTGAYVQGRARGSGGPSLVSRNVRQGPGAGGGQ